MERPKQNDDPNEKLTPMFVGEKLTWLPVTEFYVRLGKLTLENTNNGDLEITTKD